MFKQIFSVIALYCNIFIKFIMSKFLIVLRKMFLFMKYSKKRMGSFNSAPKILNDDHQDHSMCIPRFTTKLDLLDFCTQEKAKTSTLIKRTFDRCFSSNIYNEQFLKSNARSKTNNFTKFRVMQWNILSQTLGQHNDNFVKCPSAALTWNYRKYNIIEELVQYSADIICLQEVDHFNFLKMFLATQGYEGIFFPKPDSPCIYIEGNNGPDGCAIFYKKDRFKRIFSEAKILEVWKVQSNQVAIVMGLQCLNTGNEICVATTHLKARNGALLSKLRNEQGRDLLDFIDLHSHKKPVIICGDFNAEPIEPVYRTILTNPRLELGSAYASYVMGTSKDLEAEESAANEPSYTTWKIREEGEVCHTIDYIFYSKKYLNVTDVLNVPTEEDVGEGKVPSFCYPSDHFSLVCDFDFSEKS